MHPAAHHCTDNPRGIILDLADAGLAAPAGVTRQMSSLGLHFAPGGA